MPAEMRGCLTGFFSATFAVSRGYGQFMTRFAASKLLMYMSWMAETWLVANNNKLARDGCHRPGPLTKFVGSLFEDWKENTDDDYVVPVAANGTVYCVNGVDMLGYIRTRNFSRDTAGSVAFMLLAAVLDINVIDVTGSTFTLYRRPQQGAYLPIPSTTELEWNPTSNPIEMADTVGVKKAGEEYLAVLWDSVLAGGPGSDPRADVAQGTGESAFQMGTADKMAPHPLLFGTPDELVDRYKKASSTGHLQGLVKRVGFNPVPAFKDDADTS
jgi:hypothetical protein